MSASGTSSGDDGSKKRTIINPEDSLLDMSSDPDDRAEAHARAARRILEDQARAKQQENDAKLGGLAGVWRNIRAFAARIGSIGAPIGRFFARWMPGTSRVFAAAFGAVAQLWLRVAWPLIDRISHRTNAKGERRLSLIGKVFVFVIVALAVWPVFKIYYVLATTRHFRDVDITFKQIITHDRYLVFGDYVDEEGQKDNMAFNVTDSWVYWNWTPDLTFAQIPVVGKCNFHTYGWYVRVPKFVPFLGRTLLVEPVIIEAHCKGMDGAATGPTSP